MTDGTTFADTSGGDEHVSLRRVTMDGHRRGTIGPRPDHVLFWLGDGRAVVTSDTGTRWEIGPEQPVMLSAPVAYGFETTATRTTLLHLSPAYLHEVASRGEGSPNPEPWEFVQPDPRDVRTAPLRTMLREVADQILDPTLSATERRALDRRVARVVLSTFTRARSDVEGRLRLAVQFVHQHAGDPISVGDVAAAAGLSERGLQDLFRRTLDVTPMRYLREVRLDRVWLEFTDRAAADRPVTVREVALRWQFAHLGRFAGTYRQRFGESPHQTLARIGRARAE